MTQGPLKIARRKARIRKRIKVASIGIFSGAAIIATAVTTVNVAGKKLNNDKEVSAVNVVSEQDTEVYKEVNTEDYDINIEELPYTILAQTYVSESELQDYSDTAETESEQTVKETTEQKATEQEKVEASTEDSAKDSTGKQEVKQVVKETKTEKTTEKQEVKKQEQQEKQLGQKAEEPADEETADDTDDETAEVEEVSIEKNKTTMYTTTSVNVRESYSSSSNKVGSLSSGTKVSVTGVCSNGWTRISYKDKDAYIKSSFLGDSMPLLKVSSTAYWDQYNRPAANGRRCKANLTLAGKPSWIGRSCYLYKCNSDGSVGERIGYYEFHDTGYGQPTGSGSSKLLKGKSVGTIENGTCIDIFMNTRSECVKYGRRNVYIEFID